MSQSALYPMELLCAHLHPDILCFKEISLALLHEAPAMPGGCMVFVGHQRGVKQFPRLRCVAAAGLQHCPCLPHILVLPACKVKARAELMSGLLIVRNPDAKQAGSAFSMSSQSCQAAACLLLASREALNSLSACVMLPPQHLSIAHVCHTGRQEST